jgi:hypothetical protein
MKTPSPNRANGRTTGGRFAKGNPGGPGNPNAKKVAELRSTLLGAVSLDDMRAVVKKLVAQAKAGDVAASKVVLERLLGQPLAIDIEQRLDELESRLQQQGK